MFEDAGEIAWLVKVAERGWMKENAFSLYPSLLEKTHLKSGLFSLALTCTLFSTSRVECWGTSEERTLLRSCCTHRARPHRIILLQCVFFRVPSTCFVCLAASAQGTPSALSLAQFWPLSTVE